MKNGTKIFASALLASVLSACVVAPPQHGAGMPAGQGALPQYNVGEQRRANAQELAVVESLKPVDMKAQSGSTGKIAGAALGAALGGLGGSAIGHGKGKQAATIVGAAAGGAVGGSLGSDYDERASHTLGLEIVVKMSDGKLVSVIQAQNDSEKFERGQLVRVVHASGGLHVSPY